MDVIPIQKAINKSRNIITTSRIICVIVVVSFVLTVVGLLNCEDWGCIYALVPATLSFWVMVLVAPIMMIIIGIRIKRNKKFAITLSPEDGQKILSKNKSLKIFFIILIILPLGLLLFFLNAEQLIHILRAI